MNLNVGAYRTRLFVTACPFGSEFPCAEFVAREKGTKKTVETLSQRLGICEDADVSITSPDRLDKKVDA